jgi:hypothetical protein
MIQPTVVFQERTVPQRSGGEFASGTTIPGKYNYNCSTKAKCISERKQTVAVISPWNTTMSSRACEYA